MNVNQIEIALSQKISASSSNFDLLAASKALQLLKTNGVFVVSSYAGLPAAASNEGKIYFIESAETVVWSNGTDWLRLLDKNQFPTELYAWGSGAGGRLGDGSTECKCSPVREISSSTDWCQVSGGACHTAAVKSSGEIWTWGCGSSGRLGDGSQTSKCSPVREISSSTDWCQVSAGGNQTIAVKSSGEIWSWGFNFCGLLGDGTVTGKCSPVREISSSTDWCRVSTSSSLHTAAVKMTGQIWSWGWNGFGRLGDGTTVDKCSPVREISSSTDWCSVSAISVGVVGIKTSGELWAWGDNRCGLLGDGSTVSKCSPVREICSSTNWCQVSTGGLRHVAAVKTSGQLWSWGYNNFGQLGIGSATGSTCSPVREFCSANDWKQVSSGVSQSHAVKTNGQLWAWGCNTCGQLGDGTTTDRYSPVREISSSTDWCQVSGGSTHTTAIKVT